MHQVFRTGFLLRPACVLESVDLSVPSRSVFGFLGANGAGKTTLIQLIVGLRAPTRGDVLIAGQPATSPAARARIGYLPERPYFYEHLTGEGMLRYFGTLSGLKKARIEERIPVVLDAVGMTAARKSELRRYSKGMLQRIGLAQAILHDPEFLVLDEPMSGLDPLGRKEIRELILKMSDEGRTVFFSSHVISDIEAICDQVAVIQKGRMLGSGPMGQFLSNGPVRTEVVFSGMPEEAISRFSGFTSLRHGPDFHRAIVTGQEAVDTAVRFVLESGGHLQAVQPIRPTLEELFSR